MGNKLDSIRYALGQGLTGVAKPTKTLEAVDNFVEDVEAWKKNIDDQRLKLKTDTATKVREAEKEAYANLPNTKTERDLVIQGLANYKDMLYNNMSMVQNGVLKPEDNLIFQENGKQSFEIAADLINNYSTRKEEAMKEASGYYDDEGNFVEPTAGDYQAALQRINDEFMIPGGQEFKFMSNGMGNITMFKTKIDEETKTKVLDLDADGNPIPIDGQSNIPMLAFMDGRNDKAPMFVLANEVTKFTRGKESFLGASYQKFIKVKGMVGSVKDNMSQSPGFQESVKQASSSLTNTVPKVVSMLTDNGPDAQQTKTLTPSEWDALSDAQKNETISFEYTDFDGSTKKGVKSKYLQVKLATNNSFVAVLSDRDQLAAEQIAQTALISSLEQTIDPGVKFGDRNPQVDRNKDNQTDTFTLIDQVVINGNSNSLEAIVRQDPNINDYKVTKEGIVFVKRDGTLTAPINVSSGSAVDVGKLFASELGYNAETYANKSTAGSAIINIKVKDFTGFTSPREEYGGLGKLAIAKDKNKITYASEYIEKADEDKMAAQAQVVVDKARARYGNIPNIRVSFDVSGIGPKDEISITIDGVKYRNEGYKADNHKWLMENIDRALMGETPEGVISGGSTNSGGGNLDNLGEKESN